jgi:predicted O-methyltransferase YrrM
MTPRIPEGLRALLRSVGAPVLRHLRLQAGARRLAALPAAREDPGRLFDAVFAEEAFRPLQIRAEFVGLMKRCAALRPRRLLEIGTAAGGTAFLWTRLAAEDALVILVDHAMDRSRRAAFRRFARSGQRVACLNGASRDVRTLDAVRALLAGSALDVLFIDGDHRYEAASGDLATYAPFVRPGGLIAFHDVVPDDRVRFGVETVNDSGEVHRLWRELKERFPGRTEEFVEDLDQNGAGIGLLTWPGP